MIDEISMHIILKKIKGGLKKEPKNALALGRGGSGNSEEHMASQHVNGRAEEYGSGCMDDLRAVSIFRGV